MPQSQPLPVSAPLPTLAQALQTSQAQGLTRLDAQLILLHALQKDVHNRAWLLTHDTDVMQAGSFQLWQTLVQRRLQGEPMAYLLGRHEFFGLELCVDQRVLDPRPDTETLVEWALELLNRPGINHKPTIADLGTGSGAIACAIAHHAKHASVYACDASKDALDVAQHNAQRLQLPITFVKGCWLDAFSSLSTPVVFDLIVSNPPYIAENDPHLSALRHEPISALTGGADGLNDIRCIVQQAPKWLKSKGWLLLEHGYDQAPAVQQLLKQNGFTAVQNRTDLAGIARCTGGMLLKTRTP